jgi:MFS family permease
MDRGYPPSGQARLLLSLLFIAYLLSFMDRQILSLLVAPLRRDLGLSDFQLSLLQGASFAIFYVTLGIPLGRMADRRRRLTIIGVGAIVWSAMTMACGLARSFGQLFVARMGVGVGEAALGPSAYSLLSDSFPPERLARAMGIFTLAIPLGSGLSYLVGGMVIASVGDGAPVHYPLLGAIKPWQQVFLIVGAPGILVGSLLLFLPEPARNASAGQTQTASSLSAVVRFVRENWTAYRPIFLSVMLLAMASYGVLNWYPAFLMRTYGITAGQAGLIMGLLYGVCGAAGTVGAPLVSEMLAKRGYTDANLRTLFFVAVGLVPFALLGVLMPTLWLAIAFAIPMVMLLNAFYGVALATLQIATPNRMRGSVSAIYLLSNNLAGLLIGTSIIPFITDFVFRDDRKLGQALALVIAIVVPLAAYVAFKGLSNRTRTEIST